MTDFLAMTPYEFDQSPDGWRSLRPSARKWSERENRLAIVAIEKYLGVHPNQTSPDQGIWFHLGQLYAGVGENDKALPWFEKSKKVHERDPVSLLYTDATLAFLRSDLSLLKKLAIRYDLEAKDEWRKNLPIIERLVRTLEHGSTNYATAY